MTSPSPTLISDHPPRFPRLYRLKRRLTIAGLLLIGLGLAGELALLALGMPGAALLIPFTAALAVPLIIGGVLTPPVAVTQAGLEVRPMFGEPHTVPWEAVRALRPYTLLPTDEPVAQLLIGKAHMPRRDGRWIIFSSGLPFTFRLAAWLAGLGNTPVIAITDAAHQDYDTLLAALEARPDHMASPELAE